MGGGWMKARWKWRLALVVAMWVWAYVGVESRVHLVGGGYEGVVVGVSQNVEEEMGVALVQAIKSVFSEMSRRLYRATERRVFLRSVSILVPRLWMSVNLTHQAGSESFQNSDIKVDDMNAVYRHQPYTLQTGGCGEEGQFIHLTSTYLLDDFEAAWWGPRGKVLLLEWAKYRWGVFDELGYPGDPSFPLFYTNPGGRVSPTHCADRPVRGRQIDRGGRTACGVDRSGRPDVDCRFVPDPHQDAGSSLLSYPQIMSDQITHFCGQEGYPHIADAPTKQNLYCDGRSAWDVITDHADFRNGPSQPQPFQEVEFRVVQQADATYALVLDYSGSMNDHYRVHKLRRTARRWLLHEVSDGSYVAVINFNKNARLVHEMTRISSQASRRLLADAIETRADGGTSIGSGLYVAAKKVLSDRSNPVILLITDGEENENPRIDDVIDDVMRSGARVVTVAFGAEADPELEKVAEMTGGKTFTVNDIDEGQMLEDAFQGALTFQPPPPNELQAVTIHEKEYKDGGREASATFNVDFTVGKNLTLRLETGTGSQARRSSPTLTNPQVTSAPVLISPQGEVFGDAEFEADSSTWTIRVPLAQEGEWTWRVGLSGERRNFVRAKVTSQPRDPAVQPITTRAWVSQGAREINASVDKVIVFAEVKQGNNPVVKADVRALVTPPNESDPATVYKLLDNGQGADRLAGDGVYSRYITTYPSSGRYSVKAQVTDGGSALINSGFLTSPQRRRSHVEEEEEEEEEMEEEYLHSFLGRPNVCCGSVIPVPRDAPPTGPFDRSYSGGSFKVISIPQGDILAPSAVRDLKVTLLRKGWARRSLPMHASVTISWTAPGDDMDSGVVSGYQLRMSTQRSDLTEENFTLNKPSSSSTSNSSSSSSWRVVDLSGLEVNVEGGSLLHFNLSLTLTSHSTFFALRAWDDVGAMSEVSNTAHLLVDITQGAPSHDHRGTQVWVVVVVVVVVCLAVVLLMLCLARRRTKTATQRLVEQKC